MKYLLCLCLTTCSLAFAASGPKSLTGKVASFSEQYVVIETNGRLMEFARRRIMGHAKLKEGAIIQIKLD